MSGLPEQTDITIVGGGPAGLMSALLLARLGVRSVVLERNEQTDEHPKAHELNARSIEILSDVGISVEELECEASPLEDASRIQFCRSINEELGHIDLLEDPARREKYEKHLRQTLPYMNLSQSEFEKILVRHVEEDEFVDLRFGHAWRSAEEGDGGITSEIGVGDEHYRLESRYLLGCDGAGSRVRRAVDISMDGPSNIQSFVNAYDEADLREYVETPAKLYWILHPECPGTLVAHHTARRWVYAMPINDPWERPEDFTKEVLVGRIERALGTPVPELKIRSISTWHMTAQIAQTYRRGRVLLVGDAAHRFPPTGGLGMNTGVADAHNLCWKLARVLRGDSSDALLDTYETERKPIAEMNCAESLENFHKIFEVIEAVGLSADGLRHFTRLMKGTPIKYLPKPLWAGMSWLLTRVPYTLVGGALGPGSVRERVQSAIANQMNHFDRLGLDIGYVYESGALIDDGQEVALPENPVADYVPSCRSGARVPHCWSKSDERSSHEEIRYDRFTLFAPASMFGLMPGGVHLVDSLNYPDEFIPHDRVLLVRPDCHVALNISADGFRAETLVAGCAELELILSTERRNVSIERAQS